jgi:hypothetical protein
MMGRSSGPNGRREAIFVALAAAQVCWIAPVFMILMLPVAPHSSLLLWLGVLVLLLGFAYLYRALEAANVSLKIQQGLAIFALLMSTGLILRYHVYGGTELKGLGWLVDMVRSLSDLTVIMPVGWVAVMFLIFLWWRAISLARRSFSSESVGFSFRGGIVLLVAITFLVNIYTNEDIVPFVAPYFFFSLIAVALARVESVSRTPNSTQARFSGYWIGSTVAAVTLLTLVGLGVAVVFYGGGLDQVLDWLSPLFELLFIILAALGVLLLLLVEQLIALLHIDMNAIRALFEDVFSTLGQAFSPPQFLPADQGDPESTLQILSIAQTVTMIAIPLVIVALVILATWYRSQRRSREDGDESRESLLRDGVLGRGLRALVQAGRDRLADLADLVEQYGLGTRLLSAISIRRIYANVVRLATRAGYPRNPAQTPHEYLELLYEALPGSEEEVRLITSAYTSAHYGQVPETREELERIRACWRQVQRRYAAGERQQP